MLTTAFPDLGFDTIGNATLICYDRAPLLATDPWITEQAYFGSWGHSHVIPQEQLRACLLCPNVFFSHGHPDHLNGDSLPQFKGKRILLADHAGGRIQKDLLRQGYDVRILRDREWVSLSDRVRVLGIADYNQDSILLVDVGGCLLVNLNDAADRGWGSFVRRTTAHFRTSFLLALSGYGDADMINFFDEAGRRISPFAERKTPIGPAIAHRTEQMGCRYFIPFSSLHRYQRRDSVWANDYVTGIDDHAKGFKSSKCEILPAFVRYDCGSNEVVPLKPAATPTVVRSPQEFGDDWDEPLVGADTTQLRAYFRSIEHLASLLDFVNLRVGGRDHTINLGVGHKRGITFEVPRTSLMTAVECKVFDDLLIGNFMRTTLHGSWPRSRLYPDFSPYVAKYGDNGAARSKNELQAYFSSYRARAPIDFFLHRIETHSKDLVRRYLSPETTRFRFLKNVYWHLRP